MVGLPLGEPNTEETKKITICCLDINIGLNQSLAADRVTVNEHTTEQVYLTKHQSVNYQLEQTAV